jgi:hypothetical protein
MSQYPYPPGSGAVSGAGTGLSDDSLTVSEPGADSAYATSGAVATGPTTTSTSTGSTTDVAKDEAAGVGATAAAAGRQVAGTAKEQAGEVMHEARDQARSLMDSTRTEVNDQASTQQRRAAVGLRSLSDELRSMASSQREPGIATDLAHQAADKTGALATWLQDREPGDVLHELSSFARRRPGTFLALAAGAGVVAGRLTRGIAAGAPAQGSSTRGGTTSGRHLADTGTTSTRPFSRPTATESAAPTGSTTAGAGYTAPAGSDTASRLPGADPTTDPVMPGMGTTGLGVGDTGASPGNDVTR